MLVTIFLIWSSLHLIHNILAGPGLSSTSLPSVVKLEGRQTLSEIPTCARTCVDSFIQSSFSSCSESDLTCLCKTASTSGFTLGEGALQCVVSDCSTASGVQFAQAYTLCNGVSNAIQPTHATITASMQIPSTIFVATSVLQTSISSPATTTSSSVSTSQTLIGVSSLPSTLITTTSSLSASAPTAAVSNSAVTSTITPVLSKPQIIGIAVALGVLGLIAMSLLAYVCCFRGRAQRDSSYSFGGNQPLISHAEAPGGFSTSPGMPSAHPYIPSKAQSVLGQKYPAWSPAISPQRGHPGEYTGLAITPKYDYQQPTPSTNATYQTTSRLLPDKPVAPPRPRRDGTEGILPKPRSKTSPNNLKASPDSMNSGPVLQKQPSDPFLQAPEVLHPPPRTTSRGQNARRNLPRLDTHSVHLTGVDVLQPPAASYNPANYAHFAETQVPTWRSTAQDQLDTLQPGLAVTTDIPTQARDTRYAGYKPAPPPKEKPLLNKYAPVAPLKRMNTTTSTVTSFESDGEAEDIPQVPAIPSTRELTSGSARSPGQVQAIPKQLARLRTVPSPSPATLSSTPLSQIRYPAVPTITQTPVSDPVSAITPHPSNPYLRKQTPQQQPRRESPPFEISPVTPQIRRKEGFVLPQWERVPGQTMGNAQELRQQPQQVSSYGSFPRPFSGFSAPIAELSSHSVVPALVTTAPSGPAHPFQRAAPPVQLQQPIQASSYASPRTQRDASHLHLHGYAELPERGSSQHYSPNRTDLPPRSPHTSRTPPRGNFSTRIQMQQQQYGPVANLTSPQRNLHLPLPGPPAARMVAELPSPDAERLARADPLAKAGAAITTSQIQTKAQASASLPARNMNKTPSPKLDSRGARLGQAIASQTPKARGRSGSVDRDDAQETHIQLPATLSIVREESLTPEERGQGMLTVGLGFDYRPLPAQVVSQRPGITRENTGVSQMSAVSALSGSSTGEQQPPVRGTAKWTILCGPGQQGSSQSQGQGYEYEQWRG